ncbi:MAG: fumarate reductase subunit D [Gammaproteobacteria bacterium]|nr:fumarate reductase subunit D [Gammaproteobacteria bacterium]
MARSNTPLIWSLFAAGGTLSAFLMPVLVIILLLAAYSQAPAGLDYESMHAFAGNWFGKLILFALVTLSLWHAAHRLRDALHGLGLRADKTVAVIGYGLAGIGTLQSIYFLLQI